MTLPDDALRVLQETSRTFFVPIRELPAELQEVIASAYLCMRAIDEIEDHPRLERAWIFFARESERPVSRKRARAHRGTGHDPGHPHR